MKRPRAADGQVLERVHCCEPIVDRDQVGLTEPTETQQCSSDIELSPDDQILAIFQKPDKRGTYTDYDPRLNWLNPAED